MTTTTQPTRAPEIEAPENPGVIELTISEVDRQESSRYSDTQNCLICTTLKNRGYNVFSVGPSDAYLESASDRWEFETEMYPEDLHVIHFATRKPFYKPSVVGKVIRLRKVR